MRMKDKRNGPQRSEERKDKERWPASQAVGFEGNEDGASCRARQASRDDQTYRGGRQPFAVKKHAKNNAQETNPKGAQPGCGINQGQVAVGCAGHSLAGFSRDRLGHSSAVSWYQPQHQSQPREHRNEIGGDRVARLRRIVTSKEPPRGASRDEIENIFAKRIAKRDAYHQDDRALQFAQRKRSAASIQDPDWHQV